MLTPSVYQTQPHYQRSHRVWTLVQALLVSIQQDTATAAVAYQPPQPKPPLDPALANLHPWTQNLLGVLQTTEDDSQDAYIDYLAAKHR
ncbi:hypothetical protein IQ273_17130 [Nodosilinea sp. LEGE 07298]|uniref:hypothetical protein n=1 Tax=Nodosilinea sp. LEGE 07298 TaxID=2777970 RepID=UPI0018821AAE|nr:hypothetical protein [Nodosilinea sp. LEGE 07298]MBE9111131.1 hypothetical protein [Nodosilinea sp. LEGE 07298]